MDKLTKQQRSYIMSRIRGKNTKPETVLFNSLKAAGLKFRRHYNLLGNPDVVFLKARLAIFVDGDFWHGWDFKKRKDNLPGYWVTKIKRNIRRDLRYRKQLRSGGWKVLRLWEHQILKNPESCVTRVKTIILKETTGTQATAPEP